MDKLVVICEACGIKNAVDPALKEAAVCGSCKAPLKLYHEPLEGTDASFQKEVLESKMPVLVDFWAPWCGPCKMISPIVHEIAKEHEGRVKVVKVNTDESRQVAATYGIMSIPTLLVFQGGEAVDKIVGAVPKKKILEALEHCYAHI
jgi:thioredoxin 1